MLEVSIKMKKSGLKSTKKKVLGRRERQLCSEGFEPGTWTVSCRKAGRTHSIGPVTRGLKTRSMDLRRRNAEAAEGASPAACGAIRSRSQGQAAGRPGKLTGLKHLAGYEVSVTSLP